MGKPSFENLEIYQISDRLATDVWNLVNRWSHFARDTVGKQFVRAVDSIGANIAEGYGRGSYADNLRFVYIARGSLNETLCWLQRARNRNLITPDDFQSLTAMTDELGPRMSGDMNSLERQIKNHATPGQPSTQPPKG
jgi:four helix bundle protein